MFNEDSDIRWKQRFANYCKAVAQLQEFIEKENLNKLEIQGLIQYFEYTFELGWTVMRNFLVYKGQNDIHGSRDAISISFNEELIKNGVEWMQMLKDRNRSTHTYNEDTAYEISQKIIHSYTFQFLLFKEKMQTLI